MHQRTVETFEELASKDWFSCVGIRDSGRVSFASSWDEALAASESPYWRDLCEEAANQYRERLVERDRDRFNEWNKVVRMVKAVSVPLVIRKTESIVAAHSLPHTFVDSVHWDILHLGMESEFADVFPPGFYASQAYWYAGGHFPCGWEGAFPDGRLVVF